MSDHTGGEHLPPTHADVIILGVGTCGEDLALRLLGAGLQVVGIEAALVGGECAYWACLPSKMMIRAANVLQEARRLSNFAGSNHITPDWTIVANRVRNEAAGGWQDAYATQRFRDRGGYLIHGHGRLIAPHTVSVGEHTITAHRAIIIATGSSPVIPDIPGLDGVNYWTTHDVIQAATLPRSLAIIGGGVVACELGQVLARFGVQVTIVEAAPRILPAEEPQAAQAIHDALTAEGITIHTGAAIQHVREENDAITLALAAGPPITAQRLLVAAGRRPNTAGIGLKALGFNPTPRAIPTDPHMRIATAPAHDAAVTLYAMGDVTGKAMLTHIALYQSAIIAAQILDLPYSPARYDAVPRAAFTDPELGAVGLTEEQLRATGRDITVVLKQLPATFRGWLHASGNGLLKLLFDSHNGALLGATAVGPHAAELLGHLTLAIHAGVPLSQLRDMIYAFPTFYGAIGEAIGAYGRGLATVIDPTYDAFPALDDISSDAPALSPAAPPLPAISTEEQSHD